MAIGFGIPQLGQPRKPFSGVDITVSILMAIAHGIALYFLFNI